MNANVQYEQSRGSGWMPVFIPEARCLMDHEIRDLPEPRRKAVEAEGHEGVWLKVHCPERSCLTDDAKVILPAMGVALPEKKGLWLRLFCPENRCLMEAYTDLP